MRIAVSILFCLLVVLEKVMKNTPGYIKKAEGCFSLILYYVVYSKIIYVFNLK